MLTDYHLHLRPDEEGTTFDRYFTAENVERYRAAASERGIEELGVSEHVYRFRQALDLWRHPLWLENAKDDLDEYCEFVRSTPLRLGVECDFVPGAEGRTAAMLEARDFDYVVGSVHFVGVLAALALGAHNLGTALGVGQLTFAATLVYVLLSDRRGAARRPEDRPE